MFYCFKLEPLHIFIEERVELTDIALHNFVGLSCFFHKPEKFRDKIRANTFLGENIGPDVKVLVPDVKVLVPGCGSTGPRMWKYWSLDVSNCVRKCCRKS